MFIVIVEIYLVSIDCFRFNICDSGKRDISSRSPVLDKSSYSRFVSVAVAVSFLHLYWIFTGVNLIKLLQVYLFFSDTKTMGTLVNYTCKSFIKLTPGSDATIQTLINVPALKHPFKLL